MTTQTTDTAAVTGGGLLERAAGLAATFDSRRAGRIDAGDLVAQNLSALDGAGLTVAAICADARLGRVLRTIAGGCGATAFALAGKLATDPAYATLYDATVRLGLAERAFTFTVDRLSQATDDTVRQPGPQFAVARMRGAVATMTALVDRQAPRVAGPDGRAAACTAGIYVRGTAEGVVSTAFAVLDGDAAAARLGQIWYDLTASPPPIPDALAHELVGKAAFGIDPAETPRWL